MPGPALTRNIGAEERSTAAAALEIRSTVMQACLTDDSAVETSRGTRKDDIVLVGRCSYYGAITKSSIQGPRCPPRSGQCRVVW